MKLGTHMPGGERRKPIDIEDRRTKVNVTTSKNRTKIESACLLSRAFYLQVCFFYLYVLEFCCQLAYGYVLMLILLHASVLIVCLCMSLYLPAVSVTIKSGVLQLLPMKEQILHCLEVSGFYHRRY
jgi:hypothetical protein